MKLLLKLELLLIWHIVKVIEEINLTFKIDIKKECLILNSL